jgi:hypothetical protein
MLHLRNRKAQEEMVGFVLIVVIVVIIGLVVLGIMIRNPQNESVKDSTDVAQFIGSVLEYTSPCAKGHEPAYLNVRDLIVECYRGTSCSNGNQTCLELNRTLANLINNSLNIKEESFYTGYTLNLSIYSNSSSQNFLYLKEGQCGEVFRGSEPASIPLEEGKISVSLKMCSQS